MLQCLCQINYKRRFLCIVKIDLFEGRTEETKIELAREVTEVVSRVAKAPKEAIHVFINDMPEGTYYPHGEMKKKN